MSSVALSTGAESSILASAPSATLLRLPHLAPEQRWFRLDPRSKLLCMLVINILVMGMSEFTIILTCAVLVAFLNATVRINRGWFIYLGVIAISAIWYLYGGSLWKSFANALLIAICYWTCRFAIAIWMAAFIITSIGAGEVTAALRAIRLPKSFVTIITVVLRFIPLTGSELKAIIAALKLRGLVTGVGSLFLHPFRTAEYVMVPLLASLTRVIDDLAASGVIRGLGTETKPTSIVKLGFRWTDAVTIVALGALIAWHILG